MTTDTKPIHTAAATAPAAAPPLAPFLLLPACILACILDHLPAADRMRALLLTTKHRALAHFGDREGDMEAVERAFFWSGAIGRFLGGFLPARAWFELKGLKVHKGKAMRVCYPRTAERAERGLASLLEAAGVTGTE